MKTKLTAVFILWVLIMTGIQVHASVQIQKVDPFEELSLRNDEAIYFPQRETHNIEIDLNSYFPDEINLGKKIGENDKISNKGELRKTERSNRQKECKARKRENERRQKEFESRKNEREKMQRKDRKER